MCWAWRGEGVSIHIGNGCWGHAGPHHCCLRKSSRPWAIWLLSAGWLCRLAVLCCVKGSLRILAVFCCLRGGYACSCHIFAVYGEVTHDRAVYGEVRHVHIVLSLCIGRLRLPNPWFDVEVMLVHSFMWQDWLIPRCSTSVVFKLSYDIHRYFVMISLSTMLFTWWKWQN